MKSLSVDRELDWKMRLISHVAIIVAIVFFTSIAIGGPRILLISLPLGAIAVAVEIRRLQGDKREAGITADSDISSKRRRRALVLAGSVAVGVVGAFIQSLPSQATHDKYWFILVAPVMLGFMVGVVALLMLAWSYLPRRDVEAPSPGA